MSFEVWPEDRRMSSALPTRSGPRNSATGLPRQPDLLRNAFPGKHLETGWHRSGNSCAATDSAIRSAEAGPFGASAGTASKHQNLRAVVAAGSAGRTANVRFESNRAASQESCRTATRMSVSVGVAVLVMMATAMPVSTASTSDVSPPDKTALITGGTAIPTPDDYLLEKIRTPGRPNGPLCSP